MGIFDKAKKAVNRAVNKAKNNNNAWDMSSKEARERQVKRDYEYAKIQRAITTGRFVEADNYYNNLHYSARQVALLQEKHGLTFTPPVLPDAYIQVESQIEAEVPDFEFKGRDDDLDSRKAKVRADIVWYVCYNNHLDDLNPDNERNIGKLGNAFFKVAFDGSIAGPGYIGDITIGNPDPANIFPDPSAYDVDDCEFIIYAFRMHRRAARRQFGKVIDEIGNDGNYGDTEIYNSVTRDMFDDTLQVIEYWYKDDEGDIACTIQVGETEVKHIPKYWQETRHSGNKIYPFVKYCKIPNAKSFWDRSEIDTIKDLVDASDREFMNAILNDAMMSNDIILVEEDALKEGFEPSTMPGAKWRVNPNKINAVRRLGGVASNANALNMINFIHDKIEETNGNFATKGAEPPSRVNTASGLAMIREDRESRAAPKKKDRNGGFRRLYELIDWTALEFYNQDRVIMIRGKTESEPDRAMVVNSDQFRIPMSQPQNPLDFQVDPGMQAEQRAQQSYFPRIDCEINVGQGIAKSPALTLQATQEIAKLPINPQNVGLICSMVEQMGLPDAKEIKEELRQSVQPQQQPGAGQMPPPEPAQEEMIDFLQQLPQPVAQSIVSTVSEEDIPAVVGHLMMLPPEQLQQEIADIMAGLGGGQAG